MAIETELEREDLADGSDTEEVSKSKLVEGAKVFELFWLRPSRYAEQTVDLRVRLNGKFSGWKLKDELIKSLDLVIGDTVNVEVSVKFGPGVINDPNDVDVFADGDAASWLLAAAIDCGGPDGCIIDGRFRLAYREAPIGGIEGRMVKKASLILERGYRYVETERAVESTVSSITDGFLQKLLSSHALK